MVPFAYFAAREVSGNIECIMLTSHGHRLNVSPKDLFSKVSLAKLGRFLCVEPADTFSQQVLVNGLKPKDGVEWYIKHTVTPPTKDTATEAVKKLFRKRRGPFRLVPHHDSLRECDIIRAIISKVGFSEDPNVGVNMKITFSEIDSEGNVPYVVNYKSEAGNDYSWASSYKAVIKDSIFTKGEKVSISYIQPESTPMKLAPNAIIQMGFEVLDTLSPTVDMVVGGNRLKLKWVLSKQPKYREAMHNVFGTFKSAGVDIDLEPILITVNRTGEDGIIAIPAKARFTIEDHVVYADVVYEG